MNEVLAAQTATAAAQAVALSPTPANTPESLATAALEEAMAVTIWTSWFLLLWFEQIFPQQFQVDILAAWEKRQIEGAATLGSTTMRLLNKVHWAGYARMRRMRSGCLCLQDCCHCLWLIVASMEGTK